LAAAAAARGGLNWSSNSSSRLGSSGSDAGWLGMLGSAAAVSLPVVANEPEPAWRFVSSALFSASINRLTAG
jgi:hypothetical protein